MSILIKPLLTEKYTSMNAKGKYGFQVALNANKIEIKKAVEGLYGVTVADVCTLREIGKKKTRMTRTKATSGITSTIKKAIVTLAEGEVLDYYQGV